MDITRWRGKHNIFKLLSFIIKLNDLLMMMDG